MSEPAPAGQLMRFLLRVLALAVPSARREEWLREWEAELDAARRSGRPGLPLALGAVPDAWAVRSEARKGTRYEQEGEMATVNVRDAAAELRRASRSLIRAPGFTAACVVTLGVGLGATAAIFTLVDAILLRPLPYPAAERLVRVYHTFTDPGAAGTDWPLAPFGYELFEQENRAFEVFGGYWDPATATVSGDEAAERVVSVRATPSLLEVLGARAAAGRLFTLEDARFESASGVVLGHGLWQRRYGGDPSVVGRTVVLNGSAREILGVMAEGVQLPRQNVDLWIPFAVPAGIRPDDSFRIYVIARLAQGVDLASAGVDVERLTDRLPELAPFFSTYVAEMGFRTHARPLRQEVVGEVERALWILLGAVGIVLLIAAANVANLFLVRTEGRRAEVSVRSALGARRGHLLVHFLSESLLVSAAAGALGVLLAVAGVRALVSLAPPSLPRLDELQVGGATVGFSALLCLVVGLLLGAYPFLRFGRRGTAEAARGAGRGRDLAGGAVGNALVVGQVALALVLLASSALLLRSFQQLRAVDPGFEPGGVLVAELSLAAAGHASSESVGAFYRQLVERAEALPGVRRAAVGSSPLRESAGCNGTYVEGRILREGEFPPCVPYMFVGPGYWEVLGIPLREGRGFEDADASELPVVVVTDNLARRLWPEGRPLDGGVHPAPRTGPPWYRVVGVSGDLRGQGPDQPPSEVMYLPIVSVTESPEIPSFLTSTQLLVATEPGRELELATPLRSLVAELDPNVPLTVRGTLQGELARTVIRTSFTLFLVGTAAVTALVLGLVGLYGLVSYRVGARRHEIGIRMAMGARAGEVRGLVLGQSMRLTLLGTMIGVVAALVLTRVLASLLFEVSPGDPLVLAVAAACMVTTSLVASWIPAQRAARVDPAATLRVD